MADWLDWLLGSPQLRLGEEGVRLGFAYPLSTFEWAGVGVGALVLALWSYRRLEGAAWARWSLAGCRAVLLALVVLLVTGPRLVKSSDRVERDWVMVLVDRSSSMTVADARSEGGRVTREQQLRSALAGAGAVWSALDRERVVRWLGFEGGAFELARPPAADAGGQGGGSPGPLPVVLDAPQGRRTNLAGALEAALTRATARPLSGVVVFSDGRSTDTVPRSLLRRLSAERVPVFAVPLGSVEPLSDLRVDSAQGPGSAFVNDLVPVSVTVSRTGSTARAASATVKLVDADTGAVLDRRRVSWSAVPEGGPAPANAPAATEEPGKRVTLTARPRLGGQARYRVVIEPEPAPGGTAPGPGAAAGLNDLVPDNNTADVGVTLVDRPLRVLYIDGYPRWEYRFLKNVLGREKSLLFSSLLLSPGRRYVQEGSLELESVPTTPAEWEKFDVVVLGDVRPETFSVEQMQQVRRRVSTGGAGLLWIGGQGATPGAWRSTPLADLLPMTLGPRGLGSGGAVGSAGEPGAVAPWPVDVTLRPTPTAGGLGVMRLQEPPAGGGSAAEPGGDASGTGGSTPEAGDVPGDWPPALSNPELGWPRLRWAQRIDPATLKPAAEALALAVPVDPSAGAPTAAVLTMRFGAGRVVYVATDEIWRWRYGRGEDLVERFYLQLIRLLGRDAGARAGRPALITLSPTRSEVGQPVRVAVELIDQALIDAAPGTVTVRLVGTGAAGGADGLAGELVLKPAPAGSSDAADPTARRRPIYTATWVPGETGRYTATVTDSAIVAAAGGASGASGTAGALSLVAPGEVWLSDDELRRPEADHALLAEVARTTGGRTLAATELGELPTLLPRRELKLSGVTQEHTFWDTPAALLAVLLLLTLEWVGRRLIRLP